jgi:hypothetical protein
MRGPGTQARFAATVPRQRREWLAVSAQLKPISAITASLLNLDPPSKCVGEGAS